MTLVVLADIHANHAALEAAADRIDRIAPDGIVLLGDYVTDCPYPRRTMELIYDLHQRYPVYMVRGNREDYLLDHRKAVSCGKDDGWTKGSGTGALLYTYSELSAADLDFLAKLPLTAEIALPGCPPITAFHASPYKTKDWIIGNDDKLRDIMKNASSPLLLCGHAHRTVRYDRYARSLMICPSLGIPQDPKDTSSMVVLRCRSRKWERDTSAECTHIDYDLPSLIREFSESGLDEIAPVWSKCVIKSLFDRGDYASACASYAYRAARADRVYGVPPEKYWTDAAEKLGIF